METIVITEGMTAVQIARLVLKLPKGYKAKGTKTIKFEKEKDNG